MQKIKTYPCGVRLCCDYLSDRKVANISFFVASGSGFDLPNKEGIAHFYEHMFFKSTKNRTAKQILEEMDSLGGLNNAYTSQDRTCYYGKVTIENAEKMFDILSDCFFNGLFLEEELKTEKGVVCSEIDKYEDDFMDCCANNLNNEFFKGTNFAHPILGTKQSVMSITADDLREYREKNNSPGHLIISVSGGVDFEEADHFVTKYILPNYKTTEKPVVYKDSPCFKPKFEKNLVKLKKETNQVYFLTSTPTIRCEREDYLKLYIGSIMFGGTMSSRLFQRMREKEGIVYVVQSSVETQALCGNFSCYLITEKSTAERAILAYKDEVLKVIKDGFNENEFNNTKQLLRTNLLISDDNLDLKARRNAGNLLNEGEVYDLQENLDKISKISLKDVNDCFKKMLKQEFIVSIVEKDNNIDYLKLLK